MGTFQQSHFVFLAAEMPSNSLGIWDSPVLSLTYQAEYEKAGLSHLRHTHLSLLSVSQFWPDRTSGTLCPSNSLTSQIPPHLIVAALTVLHPEVTV